MDPRTLPVEEVLAIPFPSYHKPLELARSLGRSGNRADRDKAVRLLEGLIKLYPHVLALGQELVFVLIERKDHDRAEAELRRFEKEFLNLDEEFLCRWGRLFKDRGDAHAAPPRSPAGPGPDPVLAEQYYRRSLEKYGQAYRIREGHYPGINKATLLLILGSLHPGEPGAPRRDEVRESAELAGAILKARGSWHLDKPEDEAVWFPATAGEAHLLRQEWAEAATQYREALRQKKLATPHARASIRRQVERILLCFEALDVPIPEPFDDLDALFHAGPEAAPPTPPAS